MAAAHALHYGIGIPVLQVPIVLAALPVVELTQSAISQDALRRTADAVGDVYEHLRTSVPEQPVVHDDTGWCMGSEPAYLMAFDTNAATVYQIWTPHRHEEVQEVIPSTYAGVMATDRGRSDDAQSFDDVKQQKCAAHILRSIQEVVQTKTGRARDFGERLKTLLQDAMQLGRAYHVGEVADFCTEAQRVQDAMTYRLRPRLLIRCRCRSAPTPVPRATAASRAKRTTGTAMPRTAITMASSEACGFRAAG
jgi:hypothetical protein